MSTTAVEPGSSELIEVWDIPHSAEYHHQGRPGTRPELYLHYRVAAQLRRARQRLKEFCTRGRNYDLLVWDGFRSQEAQQSIFEEYKASLMTAHQLNSTDAHNAALTFVSDPSSVFPHGTGGTVDLTLTINSEPANMGTGFDEFTDQAHRDWYLHNPPVDQQAWEAHRNRILLNRAMRSAGFIGLEDEWWHFEWGTQRWAKSLERDVLLASTLSYPQVTEPAA